MTQLEVAILSNCFLLVTNDNYDGYWMKGPEKELVLCSKKDDTILNCEKERCITNCHDAYEIENVRIISKRDSSVIGHFNWYDGIRWGNNITWIKKGLFKIFWYTLYNNTEYQLLV